jgi:hypothetical protein
MKSFYCFLFLCFVSIKIFAQASVNDVVITKSVTISAVSSSPVNTSKSGLISVKKGDFLEIQPNLEFPHRDHHFLVGLAKAIGIGVLSYQANKIVHPFGNEKNGNTIKSNGSIVPSVGIGLAAGSKDFIKLFKKKLTPNVVFSFYKINKTLIAQETKKIDKHNNAIRTKVTSDGYVQVALSNATNVNTDNIVLNIQTPSPVDSSSISKFQGGIALSMALDDYGDCLGDGSNNGNDNPDPCDPTNFDDYDCYISICTPGSPDEDPELCEELYGSSGSGVGLGGSNTNNSSDPCDETSASYDPSACELATCTPGSSDYNENECQVQQCDPTSVNYDPSICDEATCTPGNPNYNEEKCMAQICDPTSVNYNYKFCNACNNSSIAFGSNTTNLLNNFTTEIVNLTDGITQYPNEKGISLAYQNIPVGNDGLYYVVQTTTPITEGTPTSVNVYTSYPGVQVVASVHTHTSSAYDAPSGQDLYVTLTGAINTVHGTMTSYNTSYVIDADGSEYALVITDSILAKSFLTNYPQSDNLSSNNAFTGLLGDEYNSYINAAESSGANENTARVEALTYLLTNSGISLYQADSSGNFNQMSSTLIQNLSGTNYLITQNCGQ